MSKDLVALLRRPYGNLTFAEKQQVADLIEELEAKLAQVQQTLDWTEDRAKDYREGREMMGHKWAKAEEDRTKAIEELEAKLELIQEEWAGAVYGDLENGVASLNAAAATDFYRRYPLVSSFGETLNRIVDGEQDDE